MTRYDKLKAEINAMSLDDFIKHFFAKDGMREYVCGQIKHPNAHCTKTDDYSCMECLKEYLKSEVEE